MVAGAIAAVLALGTVVLAPRPAEAAPGDASATGLSIALNAGVSVPPLVNLSLVNLTAVVGSAVAPAGGGTSQSGLLSAALSGLGVTSAGQVTDVTATRNANGSSATSELTGINVGVLGISAVSTGVVSAQAVCPAGADATADASVAGLSLLGQAVTLNAATPTVSASAGVTVAGLTGAQLHATARRVVSTTATTASAAAVLVDLRLTATVTLVGVDVELGTIDLAQASCQAPNAVTSGMAPTSGPTSGGTTVTVTGNGLQNTTGVTFGGTPATSFTPAADGTSLTAVAPASETAGGVAVTLARPTGNLTAGTFTYVAPTITSVVPPQGSTLGGTAVTITGTGLAGATGVTIGGTNAPISGAPTATSVTVTTGAHAAGTVPVVVTLPGADATAAGAYTYLVPTAPTVASFTPTSGPAAGGTQVTFTGTNLGNVTSVTFGGSAATLGAQSATSLTVTTTAHAAGAVPVVLTSSGGVTTATDQFTYLVDGSGATFASVLPTTVPTVGGTTITITGTGLTGATGVTVGGVDAPITGTPTATAITATVPTSESAGAWPVAVQFPAGTGTAGSITYVAPTITGVAPATGPSSGGTVVTVTGTGLLPTTAVTFGGVPGTVTAAGATSLTVTAPAHAPGAVTVVAELPGADATSAAGAFTYLDDGTGALVATVTPTTSSTSGGGTVTVAGSGLSGASALTVGGVAVTGLLVAPDGSSVSGAIPATETAGAATVALTFPAGSVTAGSLTYVAPTLVEVSPAQGLTSGGTAVTLTGTGLTGATGVTFGGVAATGVTVVDDTTVTATTPAHAVGAVDVVVTLPGADATEIGGFAFIPPGVATVAGVVPSSGTVAGGTLVTLTGTGLGTLTAVSFDGVPGTDVTPQTATTATVVTPAHAPGPVTLTLTNAGGDSWLPGGYTFLATGAGATVSTVDPTTVPTAGGSTITLTGTGLAGASGLLVGSSAATGVAVNPAGTVLTATVPPSEVAGGVPLVVQFPLGSADGGTLTYVGPTLDTVAPAQGPIAGGTLVTLAGTGLENATSVTFGGLAGSAPTPVGPGTVTVLAPAHAVGAVTVQVTLPGLDPAPATYTYLDDGTGSAVIGLAPTTLPTSGGTVTVTGTDLGGAVGLTVGGVPVTGFVPGAGSISGTVPPVEAAATLPVAVVFPAGSLAAGDLTLVAPTLVTVSPPFGVSSGGGTATLTGTGLAAVTDVSFGGTSATIDSAASDGTSITVTVPAHAAATVDVLVTLPGADAALVAAYTYLDDGTAATVTGLSPATAPTTGGTLVTVTGTDLGAVTDLTVRGVAATGLVVAPDGSSVSAVVPATEVGGGATVSLWFPAGTVVAGVITYVAPTLTAVTPASGPAAGGETVTLTGTGFSGVTRVLLGGTPAVVQQVAVDGLGIVVTTPAHLPGTVPVVVEQTGADATLAAAYTFVDDGTFSTVTDLDPPTSPTAGGGTLTITGTALGAVTGVTVDGVLLTPVSVQATEVTVTVPATETPGGVAVELVFPAGTLTAGTLTYVASTVTTLLPAAGPQSGNQTVTISGTDLDQVTAVTFDGVPGTVVTPDPSGTSLTVVTPAHVPAVVDVVLEQPGADVTLPGRYTYLVDGTDATIGSVVPLTAPLAGDVPGAITGTGLGAALGVTIGGTPVTDLVVGGGGTSITYTVPAGTAPGTVPVVVAFPGGDLTVGDLEYLDDGSLSTVTDLDPATSPTAGGGTLTITGTVLGGVTGVTIGGVLLTPVSVQATEVTVTVPATETPGPVAVELVLPGGTLPVGDLTYQAPTIAGLSPAVGVAAGGTSVTLAGTGLAGATAVTLGGVPATLGTVALDGTSITLTTPAHAAGTVDVVVTLPGLDATLVGGFSFLEDGSGATVGTPTPATSPTAGGVTVTVPGTGLAGAIGLTVGGTAVTGLTVAPDGTSVSGVVPAAAAAGPATVTVIFPTGSVVAGTITYVAPTLTGVLPADGPAGGGTLVTLTGTGLLGATGVAFGGSAGVGLVVAPDGTSATVTTSAHAVGPVDVVVTLPGPDATLVGGFTYLVDGTGATVTDLTPASSPLAGGGTMTLTGTGFSSATAVTVGATTVPVVPASDTEITLTIPSATAPGAVAVVLTFPGGTLLAGALEYVAPTVTLVDPDSGPQSGGTAVELTGTDLDGVTGVTVGADPVTGLAVDPSGTSVSFVVGAHAPGAVDVVLDLAGSPITLTGAYTYLADGTDAVVSGVTPATAPLVGNVPGTITGTGLTGATGVTVGGVAAAGVVVSGGGTLVSFTVPAGTATGPADVELVFPAGTPVPAGSIDYLDDGALSTAADVDPATSPTAGGGTATITGTGLGGVTSVTLGTVTAVPTTVTATTVTFQIPATETPGTVPVALAFEAGTLAAGDLTYVASTVTGVAPSSGPQSGLTPVVISGTDLDAVTSVTFGGVAGTALLVDPSGTSLTVLAPPHAPGAVTVVLVQPGLDVSVPAGYTYLADGSSAVVTGLTPATAPLAGNVPGTITGTGLTGATGVTVGGVAATEVTVTGGTAITFTVPAGAAPGTAAVVVVLPAGTAPAGNLTYLDDGSLATITSTTPGTSPTSGGGTITVTGTGLDGATGLTVGGVPVTDLVVALDGSSVTGTIPAAAAGGPAAVVVVFPAGTVPAGTLTYAAPVIGGVSPNQGTVLGGTTVTISGSGLDAATAVTFGGVPGTAVTVVTGGLTVVTPAAGPGLVDVVVVLPGADATLPDGYGYVPVGGPFVSGVTPTSGPTGGGTTVTISGTGLATTTSVVFGDQEAEIVGTPTATQVVVTTPAHPAGTVPVAVTNAAGTGTAPGAFTYRAPVTGPVVRIAWAAPRVGPTSGGQTVVVAGTGFVAGATTVTFGGTDALSVTVLSDTALLAVTPPGEVGVWPMVVAVDGLDAHSMPYEYQADAGVPVVPTVTGADPSALSATGGTSVTVRGTGFVPGATTVLLCGTVLDPADVAVDAAGTALTFVAPACDPGETQLLVITSGGTAGTPVTYFASAVLGAADGPGVGGAGAATTVRAVTGSSVLATTGLDVGHDGGWWALALMVSGMGLLMLRAGAVRVGVVRPRGAGPRVGRHVEVRAPRHR